MFDSLDGNGDGDVSEIEFVQFVMPDEVTYAEKKVIRYSLGYTYINCFLYLHFVAFSIFSSPQIAARQTMRDIAYIQNDKKRLQSAQRIYEQLTGDKAPPDFLTEGSRAARRSVAMINFTQPSST